MTEHDGRTISGMTQKFDTENERRAQDRIAELERQLAQLEAGLIVKDRVDGDILRKDWEHIKRLKVAWESAVAECDALKAMLAAKDEEAEEAKGLFVLANAEVEYRGAQLAERDEQLEEMQKTLRLIIVAANRGDGMSVIHFAVEALSAALATSEPEENIGEFV